MDKLKSMPWSLVSRNYRHLIENISFGALNSENGDSTRCSKTCFYYAIY